MPENSEECKVKGSCLAQEKLAFEHRLVRRLVWLTVLTILMILGISIAGVAVALTVAIRATTPPAMLSWICLLVFSTQLLPTVALGLLLAAIRRVLLDC